MTDLWTFIQARLLSTRLPGKALLPIGGEPMVLRLATIARTVFEDDAEAQRRIVVVTGQAHENAAIRAVCQLAGVECFSGNDTDVLTRFMDAAQHYDAGYVLRLTADCPLADPLVIRQMIRNTLAQEADYGVVVTGASEVPYARYPDGYDAELLSRRALGYAFAHTTSPADREHVTRILWREPRPLPTYQEIPSVDYGLERLTVDTAADYARAVARLDEEARWLRV